MKTDHATAVGYHPSVWIELERTDSADLNQKNADMANRMLERLAKPEDLPLQKRFSWSQNDRRYHYGGTMGYKVLSGDGEWFNLEYLGRP